MGASKVLPRFDRGPGRRGSLVAENSHSNDNDNNDSSNKQDFYCHYYYYYYYDYYCYYYYHDRPQASPGRRWPVSGGRLLQIAAALTPWTRYNDSTSTATYSYATSNLILLVVCH